LLDFKMGFNACAPVVAAQHAAPQKPIILALGTLTSALARTAHLKFQPDRSEGVNTITRHDPTSIWVGPARFGHSLLVPWQGDVQTWAPERIEQLQAAHFEQVLALRPELVIFGSGARHRFIAPALVRCLIEQRIGVEMMGTAAACRTYNILAGEGRAVLAALLLDPAPAGAA
jgi:uncharacterized protein